MEQSQMQQELMGKDLGRYLYHITKAQYLHSILCYGLIPGKERGITTRNAKWNRIFLTDSLEYIYKNHIGPHSAHKFDAILKVDTNGLVIVPYTYDCITEVKTAPHEFLCFEPIWRDNLSIYEGFDLNKFRSDYTEKVYNDYRLTN